MLPRLRPSFLQNLRFPCKFSVILLPPSFLQNPLLRQLWVSSLKPFFVHLHCTPEDHLQYLLCMRTIELGRDGYLVFLSTHTTMRLSSLSGIPQVRG